MTKLPIAEWQTAVADMEAGLAAAVAALDEYEARFPAAAAESPAPPEGDMLARLEGRFDQWDARLAAAGDLAESVERALAEREAAAAAWRERFTRWRERLL
jgi:hypothetical protein